MAREAVPIGGATLVWATWQRDGFPAHAMSLRNLPEANTVEAETLGAAVVLNQIDDRVPEVLHRAAASVGTGAVRRTATVGGNLFGSTLRCLLPAALVLAARSITLENGRACETDLSESLTQRSLLLGLTWKEPIASAFHKQHAEAGGPPPLIVATAVHAGNDGRHHLRVAVRDGYEVLSQRTTCSPDTERVLHALGQTEIGALRASQWSVVRQQVSNLLARTDDL